MSRMRHHKHRQSTVIAVDRNYLPMLEVSRQHALVAMATGRAHALDIKTWAKLGITEVWGRPIHVIVFPHAKAISEVKLGFGRGNSAILRRDDHICQYQGCNRRATTVDHVIPRCQGGKSTWDNLVGCCRECNSKKGGRTPEEAGMKLKGSVRSPKFHLLDRFNRLMASA